MCGEGGALLIRDDEAYLHAAEILREKGTDRTAFLRGERDKYTWVGVGSSYVLSELLAAVAVEQFKKLPEITRRKTAQAERLLAALAPYRAARAAAGRAGRMPPNWHVFAVLVDPAKRDWVITRAEGGRRGRGVSLRPAALGAVRAAVARTSTGRSSGDRPRRGLARPPADLGGVHRRRLRRCRDGLRQVFEQAGGARMTIGQAAASVSSTTARRVLGHASGVLVGAAVRPRARRGAEDRRVERSRRSNVMFNAALPRRWRASARRSSVSICISTTSMNSPRLEGQIVFEYGTLLPRSTVAAACACSTSAPAAARSRPG